MPTKDTIAVVAVMETDLIEVVVMAKEDTEVAVMEKVASEEDTEVAVMEKVATEAAEILMVATEEDTEVAAMAKVA